MITSLYSCNYRSITQRAELLNRFRHHTIILSVIQNLIKVKFKKGSKSNVTIKVNQTLDY